MTTPEPLTIGMTDNCTLKQLIQAVEHEARVRESTRGTHVGRFIVPFHLIHRLCELYLAADRWRQLFDAIPDDKTITKADTNLAVAVEVLRKS